MAKRSPVFIAPDLSVPRGWEADPSQRLGRRDVRHSHGSHTARLERAIEAVSERIRVDPSCRVARWRLALRRLANADKRKVLEQIVSGLQRGQWDHPFRDSFLALTESRTFVEIVEQLVGHLTDRDLRELVSGHPDPSLDKASARGRDKEFEWYIAALYRRAGLPVALEDPDVLIEFRNGVRSIAAKRLLSRRKVEANIKDASAQIEREGYPGYIFLDLTRYIDPDVRYFAHWRQNDDAMARRMQAFADNPGVRHRWSTLVQGAFVRASYPLISPGFVYGTAEQWIGVGLVGGDREEHIELTTLLLLGAKGV